MSDSGSKGDWITNVSSSASLTFTGLLSKELGSGQILQVSKDNSTWVTLSPNGTGFSFSGTSLGLSGSTYLYGRVRDTNGDVNGSTWSQYLTIDTGTYTGSLSLLNYSGNVSNGSAAGQDNDFSLSLPSAEPGATIAYQRFNGTGWDPLTGASQTALADGTYRYRATATDLAGNTATSAELSVAVDGTAPGVPTLALNNGVSEPMSKAQLTAGNGAILVATSESGATVSLTITSDALGSSPVNKTFTSSGSTQGVVFTSSDAAVLGDGTLTATVTITDPAGNSNTAVPLSFSYVAQPVTILGDLSISRSQNGTEAGPTASRFTLTRTGDLSAETAVTYVLSGSALPDVDYSYADTTYTTNGYGTVLFAAGSATATISFQTIDNQILNSNPRTISVKLNKPDAYNLVSTAIAATATLVDDETGTAIPELSVSNISLTEGSGTDWVATADVILSQGTTSAISVTYSFRDGSATNGIDYIGTAGSLSIAAGSLGQRISFTIKADTSLEADEDFYIDLISSSSGATLKVNASSSKITILNDDTNSTSLFATPKTLSLPGILNGADLNDSLTGSSGSDTLNGAGGDDTLTGMQGSDLLSGGTGSDTFKYSSFADSNASAFDSITDFSTSQGDRIGLSQIPTRLWSLGTLSAASLSAALTSAYADADRSTSGLRPLGSEEAMSFRWGTSTANRATYLVVDNPYSSNTSDDLLIRVGGLSFSVTGETSVQDIFAIS